MAKWIPTELYKQILTTIPYVCVDLVIVHNKQYLMVLRKQEPLSGEWYLPGGRLKKGELLPAAALRIAHGEVGLPCKYIDDLGYYMGLYDKSPFDIPIHTVSFVVLLEADRKKVKLDKNHSMYAWGSDISSKDIHSSVNSFLEKVKDKGWF